MLLTARVVAIVIALVVVAACGGEQKNGPPESRGGETASARVERCTERFLRRARPGDARPEEVRRYVEATYCAPFAKRGWVYEDGTLSIASQRWLEESGSEVCATAAPGRPAESVPCEALEGPGPRVIECALLHHVRRSEVRSYVAELRRENEVECDDGTPLAELGAPAAGSE